MTQNQKTIRAPWAVTDAAILEGHRMHVDHHRRVVNAAERRARANPGPATAIALHFAREALQAARDAADQHRRGVEVRAEANRGNATLTGINDLIAANRAKNELTAKLGVTA